MENRGAVFKVRRSRCALREGGLEGQKVEAMWRESAGKEKRGPISKQRNAHLQPVLIETAKLAPQFNETLKAVREKELTKGHANRATLAVARKLVAYLLAVDRAHFAELKKTKDPAMTAA